MTTEAKRWKYVVTTKKLDDKTGKPKVYFTDNIKDNQDGTITMELTRKQDGSIYKRITCPKIEADVEEKK